MGIEGPKKEDPENKHLSISDQIEALTQKINNIERTDNYREDTTNVQILRGLRKKILELQNKAKDN